MNVTQDEQIVKSITTIAQTLVEIQKTLSEIVVQLKGLTTAQYEILNKR